MVLVLLKALAVNSCLPNALDARQFLLQFPSHTHPSLGEDYPYSSLLLPLHHGSLSSQDGLWKVDLEFSRQDIH